MRISVAGRNGDSSGKKSGEPGGRIEINLKEGSPGGLLITGPHYPNKEMLVSDTLVLDAHGGDGAPGEIGADGKNGTRGTRGQDATQYSCGTDGTRGGDGEHGGAGSNGGHAGNGGRVVVTVDRGDLALLAAIGDVNVNAGRPGAAGRHGQGGMGGQGGAGGRSYTWTTELHHHSHHTDIHGHHHPHSMHQSITHTNPGGSDGRNGSRGGQHTYPLHPGQKGSPGSVAWEVRESNSIHGYGDRYQINLQHIRFNAAGQSGIFEPGDVIDAHYQVSNAAQTMPTPHEKVPLSLSGNADLQLVQKGFVPGSIPPGETYPNVEPLVFKILAPTSHTGRHPYTNTINVAAIAENTRLNNRPFTSNVTSLKVQYPVILLDQPTHYTLSDGELVLQACAQNIANRALGSERGREVFVQITTGDEMDRLSVEDNIQTIDPQAVNVTERHFQFPPETSVGANQQLYAKLYLQPIDGGKHLTLIQQQAITVQFTLNYQQGNSGFLLVTNAETTPAQFDHWYKLLGQFAGHQPVSVWNTSLYGSFDLQSAAYPLLQSTANGTIVVLDNGFAMGNRRTKNHRLITPAQVEAANRDHHTSLLIVGENEGLPDGYKVNSTVTFPETGMAHDSLDDLLSTMLLDEQSFEQNYCLRVPTKNDYYLFKTDRNTHEDATRLRLLLAEVFPGRRYHVKLRINNAMEQAVITIHRLANPYRSHGAVPVSVGLDVDRSSLELIENMPFSQKLRLFTQSASPYHRQLAQALTADLLEEQRLLDGTKNYGSFGQRIMRKYQRDFSLEMERLQQLVLHLFRIGENGDPQDALAWSPMVIRMIAEVQFHAEQHSTFWTRFAHWFVPQAVEQIKETTSRLCQQVVRGHAPTIGREMRFLNEDLDVELRRLRFEQRLDEFIVANTPRRSNSFFAARRITPAAFVAAQELKQIACNPGQSITERSMGLFQTAPLKPWFDEFQLLYPASPQLEMAVGLG